MRFLQKLLQTRLFNPRFGLSFLGEFEPQIRKKAQALLILSSKRVNRRCQKSMSRSSVQNTLPRQVSAFSTASTSWHDVSKTRAFQPGYGIVPAQRNFTALLNFVETPLEWEAPEARKIAKGHSPISRHFAHLNRFINPEKSLKQALFIAGTTLGVLFVLMVVGVTRFITTPTDAPTKPAHALVATSLHEEPLEPEEETMQANALFAVAHGLEASSTHKKTKPAPFRNDPFKPLVELDWLKSLLNQSNAEKKDASFTTSSNNQPKVQPFANQPAEPSLGVPVESLIQFVGVVSNEDPRKPATILVKLLNETHSILLSKRIGSSFEYGGNYFTLTSVKGGSLYLTVNGLHSRVELSNRSSAQVNTKANTGANTGANTQVSSRPNQGSLPNTPLPDATIEKLLNDLGNV